MLFEDERLEATAQAAREAWRAANGLIRLGVEMGDYVSVWVPTGPDVLRAWFGANAAGAVYAPLNLAAKGGYLEHTLNLAGSKVLVVHHQLAERLHGIDAPSLETIVVVGGPAPPDLPWRTVALEEVLADVGDHRPELPRPVEPWDDLSLIYTSGTTGPSKGVRAAYAAFWNYANCFILPFVDGDDRYLNSLPMFHTAGTGITYSMLRAGGSVALNKGFSARGFWDDVRRFEATITIAIHGMTTFMLNQPPSPDDADNPLQTVYMGPLSQHKEFAERFGVSVYTAYGMTEVPVPIVSGLNPDDEKSCGRAADPVHYELRLVDEHDLPVPPGTPGELVVRHTSLDDQFRLQEDAGGDGARPGATAGSTPATSSPRTRTGKHYFVDRIKDAIRRRGENISSFEVETEVMSHPLVKDAAAIAVKNPELAESSGDEEVKIVVVLEEGATLDPVELTEYLAGRMPAYWVPRFVEFLPELPRTESTSSRRRSFAIMALPRARGIARRPRIKLKREALT